MRALQGNREEIKIFVMVKHLHTISVARKWSNTSSTVCRLFLLRHSENQILLYNYTEFRLTEAAGAFIPHDRLLLSPQPLLLRQNRECCPAACSPNWEELPLKTQSAIPRCMHSPPNVRHCIYKSAQPLPIWPRDFYLFPPHFVKRLQLSWRIYGFLNS